MKNNTAILPNIKRWGLGIVYGSLNLASDECALAFFAER